MLRTSLSKTISIFSASLLLLGALHSNIFSSSIISTPWGLSGIVIDPITEVDYAGDGSGSGGGGFSHSLVSDGKGGAVMVWDTSGPAYSHFIYSQVITASGETLSPTPIAIETSAASTLPAYGESVISDGNGGSVIAWWDSISMNIYAQRLDNTGSLRWGIGGKSISSVLTNKYCSLNLANTSDNKIVFCWNSAAGNVVAQKTDADGTPLWGSGLVIQPAASFSKSILPNSDGGMIIPYTIATGNTSECFLAKVNSSGTRQWAGDANVTLFLDDLPYITFEYAVPTFIGSDGSGGAILAYQVGMPNGPIHQYVGTKYDIYVNRVNSNGNILWGAKGVAIANALNESHTIIAVFPNNNGGMTMLWEIAGGSQASTFYFVTNVDSNGGLNTNPVNFDPNDGCVKYVMSDAKDSFYKFFATCAPGTDRYNMINVNKYDIYGNLISTFATTYDASAPEEFICNDVINDSTGDGVIFNYERSISGPSTTFNAMKVLMAPVKVQGTPSPLSPGQTRTVPNPFKTGKGYGTTIEYVLAANSDVKLIIYNIKGQSIWTRSFSSGSAGGTAGENNIYWDGVNDFGRTSANGAYIYMITSGSKILSKGQMIIAN